MGKGEIARYEFSHSVFKSLLLQTRKNQGLFWKRLKKMDVCFLTAFDNGYVGKQPVVRKEYYVEYWLKEL